MTDRLITETKLIEALNEQRQDLTNQPSGTRRSILPQLIKFLNNPFIIVISGLRRSGKSTVLKQLIDDKLGDNFYYINFDDERLVSLTVEDFPTIEKVM